jgi:hypothetical protein
VHEGRSQTAGYGQARCVRGVVMKRRKRIIWWESSVGARPASSAQRVPEYDEWARVNVEGFKPALTFHPFSEPRPTGLVPERLFTLGEALTQSLTDLSYSVPEAAAALNTTVDTFIDWALDRGDPGRENDAVLMTYLGIDYYTLRGLTLRSQMRRTQLRIHQLPA